jgi:hypothetical protein
MNRNPKQILAPDALAFFFQYLTKSWIGFHQPQFISGAQL